MIDLVIKHKPKTLEAKIMTLLSDSSMSQSKVLEEIRKLVDKND